MTLKLKLLQIAQQDMTVVLIVVFNQLTSVYFCCHPDKTLSLDTYFMQLLVTVDIDYAGKLRNICRLQLFR